MGTLPEVLTKKKFTLRRGSESMLDTLIYLAGDVERYLLKLKAKAPKKELGHELANMAHRLEELEKL